MYFSVHRSDLFPNEPGRPKTDCLASFTGAGNAKGTSVNVCWPGEGYGDPDYIQVWNKLLLPIGELLLPVKPFSGICRRCPV